VAVEESACFRCTNISSSLDPVKVISMSLYGAARRYTMGAVRNAQLAPVIYPGWSLRFYCKSSKQQNGVVPERLPTFLVNYFLLLRFSSEFSL